MWWENCKQVISALKGGVRGTYRSRVYQIYYFRSSEEDFEFEEIQRVEWNSFGLMLYIPGTCLSSILGVEPSKTRPFSSKTRVIWVPGIYIYIFCFVFFSKCPEILEGSKNVPGKDGKSYASMYFIMDPSWACFSHSFETGFRWCKMGKSYANLFIIIMDPPSWACFSHSKRVSLTDWSLPSRRLCWKFPKKVRPHAFSLSSRAKRCGPLVHFLVGNFFHEVKKW